MITVFSMQSRPFSPFFSWRARVYQIERVGDNTTAPASVSRFAGTTTGRRGLGSLLPCCVDVVLLWGVGTTNRAAEPRNSSSRGRFAECTCRDLGWAVVHQGEGAVRAAAAGALQTADEQALGGQAWASGSVCRRPEEYS